MPKGVQLQLRQLRMAPRTSGALWPRVLELLKQPGGGGGGKFQGPLFLLILGCFCPYKAQAGARASNPMKRWSGLLWASPGDEVKQQALPSP